MRVAIVHELLTVRGGAERVCRVFADMFPDAPIYTLLYNEKRLGAWFPSSRVRTSSLQRTAALSTNHHLYLRRFPRAVEEWDFSAFDLVISSSSAFAHGIITNGHPRHLSYIHSPARYLWDRTHDVTKQNGFGVLGAAKKKYLTDTFHTLRVWDSEAAERADTVIAASKEVRRRIQLYWRRESDVIHPPVDHSFFTHPLSNQQPATSNAYYLLVSTLAAYKRIDLAIEAANRGKFKLVIAGEGRDRARLERMAGPTVEFVGFTEGEPLQALYAGATATLFPGEEDFGIVPLESMASGTPVLAYRSGGALETVRDGKTGLFFDTPTPESLLLAIRHATEHDWNPTRLRAHAEQWSQAKFEEKIRKAITHGALIETRGRY